MQNDRYKKENYPQYFFPEINSYIRPQKEEKKYKYNEKFQNITNYVALSEMMKTIKEENDKYNLIISEFSNKLPDDFYENRKNGENESRICELIRKDLIDDFITYINRENY